MSDQLVQQQHEIFPRHQRVELALAVQARAELVGQLLEADRAAGVEAKRSSRILNPWPESRRTARSKAGRVIMKKPLIGSLSSAATTRRAKRVAKPLIGDAAPCPTRRAAARDVAAADDDIERPRP